MAAHNKLSVLPVPVGDSKAAFCPWRMITFDNLKRQCFLMEICTLEITLSQEIKKKLKLLDYLKLRFNIVVCPKNDSSSHLGIIFNYHSKTPSDVTIFP